MSSGWRLLLRRPPPWEGCCVEHDRKYWMGGSASERFRADVDLALCVARDGHRYWALLMFIAVRLFGGPYWPTGYRWGYGHRYPKPYEDEETA